MDMEKNQPALQMFWSYQLQEIKKTTDFKNKQLPVTRIKKIMRVDEDVHMRISAEAVIFVAKACELFILELTTRAWFRAEENKRRTLQKNDVAAAIAKTDFFEFLARIVPWTEMKEEGIHGKSSADAGAGGAASGSGQSSEGQVYVGTPLEPPPLPPQQQPAVAAGIDPTSTHIEQPAMRQGLQDDGAYRGRQGLKGQGYVGTTAATPHQQQPTVAADVDPTQMNLQDPAQVSQRAMSQHGLQECGAYGGGQSLEVQDYVRTDVAAADINPASTYLPDPVQERDPSLEKGDAGQGLEGQGSVETTTMTPPQQPVVATDIDPTLMYLPQDLAQISQQAMWQQVLQEGGSYAGGNDLDVQDYLGTAAADDINPASIYLPDPAQEWDPINISAAADVVPTSMHLQQDPAQEMWQQRVGQGLEGQGYVGTPAATPLLQQQRCQPAMLQQGLQEGGAYGDGVGDEQRDVGNQEVEQGPPRRRRRKQQQQHEKPPGPPRRRRRKQQQHEKPPGSSSSAREDAKRDQS